MIAETFCFCFSSCSGVNIISSYLHECVQPELPEYGHPTSQPLSDKSARNADEKEIEKEGLQELLYVEGPV